MKKIALHNNPDIVCLTETHLKENDRITVEGYQFFGSNRKVSNVKGSGGVGILINNTIYEDCKVIKSFVLQDNVIGVSLQNNYNDFETIVYCVYLPPEGSKYATNNERILNKLTIKLYRRQNADQIFICGDFNARVGKSDDIPLTGGGTSNCVVLDEMLNSQGTKLLNFISDIKGCIINGQVTPHLDNFTSVAAHKGNAVVDYHLTRQSDLKFVKEMEIVSCVNLIDQLDCQYLVTDRCRILDHQLLTMKVNTSLLVSECLLDRNLGSVNIQ